MTSRFTRLVVLTLLLVSTVGAMAAPAVATPGNETTATPTPTATPTATATPTPTPTPAGEEPNQENGTQAAGSVAAELYVEQPRYVDSSASASRAGGTMTYTVSGDVLELEPQNFNASDVVKFGVREDVATLTFDKSIGRYILNTQETAGTFRVFWTVREGGDTTTYTANIKVEQAAFVHLSPDQYDELQTDADFGSWVVDQFEGAGLVGNDATLERVKSVVEDAVTWYQFYRDPFSALTGQFTTFAIMLLTWPAGWIIMGVALLAYFIRDRRKNKLLRRYKRQFASVEDVDEAERRAWERERKRTLSMKSFEDLGLTTSDAQAVKQHFDISNPRQFLDKLRSAMHEKDWVRIILGAHSQLGDKIRVERDPSGEVTDAYLIGGETETARADGGVDVASGDDTEFELDVEDINPDEASDEIIMAMDWASLDPGVLWRDEVDSSNLPMPIKNAPDEEEGDLVDDFGVAIGEDGNQYHIIERREEFAEILIQIIEHIAASDYCDDDGRIRPEKDMLDFLFTFAAVGSEKYRLPLWTVRDIFLRCQQLLDADDRMRDLADRSQEGSL